MRKRLKWFVAIASGALLLALAFFLLVTFTPLGITLRQTAGYFNRSHFDAVVTRVRAMPLVPEKELQFRLDDPSDPKSLRPVKPTETFDRGQGGGSVWAILKKDGSLAVAIETTDLGHAGEYGFGYSDVPLVARPFEAGWFTVDVPGPLSLVKPDMKIDDHWWRVLNNLD